MEITINETHVHTFLAWRECLNWNLRLVFDIYWYSDTHIKVYECTYCVYVILYTKSMCEFICMRYLLYNCQGICVYVCRSFDIWFYFLLYDFQFSVLCLLQLVLCENNHIDDNHLPISLLLLHHKTPDRILWCEIF